MFTQPSPAARRPVSWKSSSRRSTERVGWTRLSRSTRRPGLAPQARMAGSSMRRSGPRCRRCCAGRRRCRAAGRRGRRRCLGGGRIGRHQGWRSGRRRGGPVGGEGGWSRQGRAGVGRSLRSRLRRSLCRVRCRRMGFGRGRACGCRSGRGCHGWHRRKHEVGHERHHEHGHENHGGATGSQVHGVVPVAASVSSSIGTRIPSWRSAAAIRPRRASPTRNCLPGRVRATMRTWTWST